MMSQNKLSEIKLVPYNEPLILPVVVSLFSLAFTHTFDARELRRCAGRGESGVSGC